MCVKMTQLLNNFNFSHPFHYLKYLGICPCNKAKKAVSDGVSFTLSTCRIMEHVYMKGHHPSIRHASLPKMHQLSLASFFIQ